MILENLNTGKIVSIKTALKVRYTVNVKCILNFEVLVQIIGYKIFN